MNRRGVDAAERYEAARDAAHRIPGARFPGFETGGHVVVRHQRELIEEIARFLISGAR